MSHKTLTVKQLKQLLSLAPDNAKVYLSRDSEGNSYGTLDTKMSLSYEPEDNTVILFPFDEGLNIESVSPLGFAKQCAEWDKQYPPVDYGKEDGNA
jgi:hypothetical protein